MRARFAIVLLLGGLGCGPSLRMVHESTVYFERCHAADLRDEIPLETKTACWTRWLDWYTEAQSPTRIVYARERIVHLAAGELGDPLPLGTAELPTDADVDTAPNSPIETSPSRSPSIYTPEPRRTYGSQVCQPICRPGWDRCIARCDGFQQSCVGACQSEYATCMSGCN